MRRRIPPIYAQAIVFGLVATMHVTTALLLATNALDALLVALFLAFGGATAAMGLMATFIPRVTILRGRWTRSKGLWWRPMPLHELRSGRRVGSAAHPTTTPISF